MGLLIKVAVGQVWTNGKIKVTISRVSFTACFSIDDYSGKEELFCYLTRDGFPDGWPGYWKLVEELKEEIKPEVNQLSLPNEKELEMQFFRCSLHPENCQKCGAPKPCNYHS